MTEPSVRPLESGDRADWDRLWAGYLDFYGTVLDGAVSDFTWARLMDSREPVWGLVAEDWDGTDASVVGMANYVLHANTWAKEPVCYLEDLFVDPAARGKGAGRALIDSLVGYARAHAWHRVYWMTRADNAGARVLYDKVADATDWVRYDAHM